MILLIWAVGSPANFDSRSSWYSIQLICRDYSGFVYDALVEPPSPREVNYVADGVFLPLRYHHKFDNVVYLIH